MSDLFNLCVEHFHIVSDMFLSNIMKMALKKKNIQR